MKTQPKVVELVDELLDDHIYSEIAEILNEKGIRPVVLRVVARPTRGSPTCEWPISPFITDSALVMTGCETEEC